MGGKNKAFGHLACLYPQKNRDDLKVTLIVLCDMVGCTIALGLITTLVLLK
jgi:hypothetical protein